MNSDHQQPSGGAVRSSDLVRPKLSSAILTNLARGRGVADRGRERPSKEVVPRNSVNLSRIYWV
jgi:hypothetical protein